MIIVPFSPEHLKDIDLQSQQTLFESEIRTDEYALMLSQHDGWTGLEGNRVVACAGLVEQWPGRYAAWAVISATIGASGMIKLTRAIRRGMDMQKGRIEAFVAEGFDAGHRWALMLGFTLETPEAMQGWLPNGNGAFMYARVA